MGSFQGIIENRKTHQQQQNHQKFPAPQISANRQTTHLTFHRIVFEGEILLMTSVLDWLLSSGKNVSYFVQIERENVKSAHIDEFNKQTKQKKKKTKKTQHQQKVRLRGKIFSRSSFPNIRCPKVNYKVILVSTDKQTELNKWCPGSEIAI